MLKVNVDPPSRYHVFVPEDHQHDELITLVDAYLAYDKTLPLAQQSFFAPYLAELREQCVPHTTEFYHSEAQRSIASDTVKRLDQEVFRYLKQALLNLRALFWKTPSKAEAWGFDVKQTTGSINFPRGKKDQRRVLNSYIAKEESRPLSERFDDPDLNQMIAVRDQLQENMYIARSRQKQRKTSRAARDEIFRRLRETLRLAAGAIIVLHFDHKITLDLQKWGFDVFERSTQSPTEEIEAKQADNAEADAFDAVSGAGSIF